MMKYLTLNTLFSLDYKIKEHVINRSNNAYLLQKTLIQNESVFFIQHLYN